MAAASVNLQYTRVSIDPATWQPVAVPCSCDHVALGCPAAIAGVANANSAKFRTDQADAKSERTIAPGDIRRVEVTRSNAAPWPPRGAGDMRFPIGTIVGYLQSTGGSFDVDLDCIV